MCPTSTTPTPQGSVDRLVVLRGRTDRVLGLVLGGLTDSDRVLGLVLGGVTDRVLGLVLRGLTDRVRRVSFTWADG